MNEDQTQPTPLNSSDEWVVSEDSQFVSDSSAPQRPEESSGAPPFSSEDLIPHPSTEISPPTGSVPGLTPHSQTEPTIADRLTAPADKAVQLTAEIYASGAIPGGTMLGHFMIKSYIGGGGMGRVYLATDTALDRNVAVKVLPRQRANDQGMVARFMNEARSAARLNHEHIAQVYFAGEQDGIPYIVFEYVEGINIRSMVDDYDVFPLPQALNYLIQIAHALAHAANHGVVHRDVKPSNILITREGRAKLIDMGLARLLDPSHSKDDLTASGVTLGTFDYISPEQARDPRNADIRSDIYSLGCTFFFMLAGRPPFPEGTVLQKLLQHQGDEPPDIRSFQPNIPSEVAQLIQKMMAKDPRQRFQTPSVLIDALIQVAKMIGLQPTGPGKLNWVMGSPSKTSQLLKHLPWIVAVLVLLGAYFPLNLYWGQFGKLEIPKELSEPFSKGEPFWQEDTSLTTTRSPGPAETDSEKRDGKPEQKPERKPTLSMAFKASGRPDEWFGRSPGLISSDRSLSGTILWQERFVGELSPPAVEGRWTSSAQPVAVAVGLPVSLNDRNARPASSVPGFASEEVKPLSLCVDPDGLTPDSFKTLDAALAAAENGATIRLKWNDAERIDPLALTDRQLKFVAEEGYRPVLRFEPSDNAMVSPGSRTMIMMRSCDLEFQEIAMEMRIRQDDMGLQWTLFELTGANRLRFVRATLTIQNAAADLSAYHQEVSFFRNVPFGGAFEQIPLVSSIERTILENPAMNSIMNSAMNPMLENSLSGYVESPTAASEFPTPAGGGETLTVEMVDSVLRGEANCLRCDRPEDIVFRAENSMFALAKSFVRAEDTGKTVPPETVVRILFHRVTYFGRQAFVKLFRNSFDTEPMRLEIDSRRSIFFLSNVPLIDFRGARFSQEIFDSLKWIGEVNYFQDLSLGCRFRPALSVSDGGLTYEMPFSEWSEGIVPTGEKTPARLPRINRLAFEDIRKPMHLVQLRDLMPIPPNEPTPENEEIKTVGAIPPGSPAGSATGSPEGHSGRIIDRQPIQSDYGRLIFEPAAP